MKSTMPDNPTAADLPLNERLLRVSLGGCSCLTKAPDIKWHDQFCHYRVCVEALEEIERLKGTPVMNPTAPERQVLEKAARALYAILCESNGVSDNIWRLKDGTEIRADWPWASFSHALDLGNEAYADLKRVLGPDFNFYGAEENNDD
jgi:hypothetical protein